MCVEKVLADADIGVEVLYLGFESAHPPVETGEAYESVIKAMEEAHAAVLRAEAYTNEATHRAAAEAHKKKKEAQAYRIRRIEVSKADAASFKMRKRAYDISPAVFAVRKRMNALEEGTENGRKYIIPPESKIGSNVILNLEDKLQFGVGDIDFGEVKKEGE